MRLLLTSDGLTTPELIASLLDLEPRPRFAFVPSAARSVPGPKPWMIRNLNECASIGSVDIVELAALTPAEAADRLAAANVIVLGGGSSASLIEAVTFSGVASDIRSLLEGRALLGISAGSIVAGPSLAMDSVCDHGRLEDRSLPALALVPFHVLPHFGRAAYPGEPKLLRGLLAGCDAPVYRDAP